MSEPATSGRRSEKEIFFEALDKASPAERAAFLDGACGTNAAQRARIEGLLADHFQPDTFMKGPAATRPNPDLSEPFGRSIEPGETQASMIGRYKLLEKLGEGGFGEVWMAEQREPVKRRVALKIIKLGMDSKQVVARFEAERQALALMDHPNIAKILDAGTTAPHSPIDQPPSAIAPGRPYFVMELVRGVRITDYCDQNQLPTRERLDLFIKVCQAIQHAHQKGIIHRDIKPSNILVTLRDGVPVPKVIDFGIAKATNQELTDKTLFTQFSHFIGTPAYISPEQVGSGGLDIDTRSDIYSLGVLLYELLVGRTPFDPTEMSKGGLDALRLMVREKEPVKPSTRLKTLSVADQTATAQRRKTEPIRLTQLLQGDLDWIVMKCLEKDRTRRYETAIGLASDIRHHLADEPVLARPPSPAYQMQKLWRRHRTAFAVGTVFAAFLVVAAAASTWQAIRATRAEALSQKRVIELAAERDAKDQARLEAEATANFLTQLFESPDPKGKGRGVTVVDVLERAVKKLERDRSMRADHRARLFYTLGTTYEALGLDLEAISLLEKARDYHLVNGGEDHPNTLRAIRRLARCYGYVGRTADAVLLRERYWQGLLRSKGQLHSDTLEAMADVAVAHCRYGSGERALQLCDDLLPLRQKANGPLHQKTLAVLGHKVAAYLKLGRKEQGLKLAEELLTLRRQALGPEHRDTLRAMNTLAHAYALNQRTNAALELYENVLSFLRKNRTPGTQSLHLSMHGLVRTYAKFGRLDAGLALGEELLRLNRQALGPEHRETLGAMNTLAMIYRRKGRVDDSIHMARSSLDLHRQVLGAHSEGTLTALTVLATALQASGRIEEAVALESEALRLKRQHFPQDRPALLASIENLATCYERALRHSEAAALRREEAALRTAETQSEPAANDEPEP